jgi:site-specific recombinase XerD
MKHRGWTGECIFCNERGDALSPRTFADWLKRTARAAGLDPSVATPHNFRRFFAQQWIRQGGDAFGLMKALNHSSITMSLRYVASFDDDQARQNHEKFAPMDRLYARRR